MKLPLKVVGTWFARKGRPVVEVLPTFDGTLAELVERYGAAMRSR